MASIKAPSLVSESDPRPYFAAEMAKNTENLPSGCNTQVNNRISGHLGPQRLPRVNAAV
jgi:hypothetical protein